MVVYIDYVFGDWPKRMKLSKKLVDLNKPAKLLLS